MGKIKLVKKIFFLIFFSIGIFFVLTSDVAATPCDGFYRCEGNQFYEPRGIYDAELRCQQSCGGQEQIKKLCEMSSNMWCCECSICPKDTVELPLGFNSCSEYCKSKNLQGGPYSSNYFKCCKCSFEISSPPVVPILSIIIPGLNLTSDPKILRVCAECLVPVEDGSECPDEKCLKWTYTIPWIGQYISAFYKWAVSAIAIFAVLMIIYAGFSMITAAGNAEKVKGARDNIFASVIGILLILVVHQVLAMVNPELVIFKPLIIGSIKRIEIDISVVNHGADSDGASMSSNSCVSEKELVKIDASKFGGISAKDPRLLLKTYQALLSAQNLAKQAGKSIYITSAFRTLDHQQSLWDEAVKKYGSESAAVPYVARPSCGAPHLTGGAVDVCLAGTTSCNQIAGKFAKYSSDDIVALQNFMTQAGFVRYCGEWWHFEYGTKRWENGKTLPPGPNRCN